MTMPTCRQMRVRVSLLCALYWFLLGHVVLVTDRLTVSSLMPVWWTTWLVFGVFGAVLGTLTSPPLWLLLSRRCWRMACGLIAVATGAVVVFVASSGETVGSLIVGAFAQVLMGLGAAAVLPVRRRTADSDCCPVCQYDLRGVDGRPCPECGWRRPTSLRPSTVRSSCPKS